jgi:hypothetical protein
MAAIFSKMDGDPDNEVYRRFLEHSEQFFQVKYLLGSPHTLKSKDDFNELEDSNDEESDDIVESKLISDDEKSALYDKLESFFNKISVLSVKAKELFTEHAKELDIKVEDASSADKEVIYEFVENDIYTDENFMIW